MPATLPLVTPSIALPLDGSDWQNTSEPLSCRVRPLPDKWLSGLLLRCNEMHNWQRGTPSAYLLHNSARNPRSHPIILSSPLWLLDELAGVLALPPPISPPSLLPLPMKLAQDVMDLSDSLSLDENGEKQLIN